MNELPRVVIVMARCNKSRNNFGIRFEEKKRGQWVADWSFAIKETSAKKEGYDKGVISGSFVFENDYPGCSYCHARPVFKCSCGKVSCWNGEQLRVTCPWCLSQGELSDGVESLGTETDR